MQRPSEKPANYSNGRQTTSLLINTEVSNLVIKGTMKVDKFCLYGEKS